MLIQTTAADDRERSGPLLLASACYICPSCAVVCPLSFGDRNYHARTDRLSALANGEALLFLLRDRSNHLHVHGRVVAGHDHLGAGRQRALSGHIGGPEIELRPIVVEERRVPTALFLR